MTFVRIALTALLVGAYTTVLAENRDESPAPAAERDSTSDLALMAQIRRELVGDKSLSLGAHNVNIAAHEGVVTLTGKVRSVAEKNAIEAKAAEIAGKGNIRNEISVQP